MTRCTPCLVGHETCRRCASRLCSEHTPFGGHACADCELAYYESRDTLHIHVWFVIGFALPWLLMALTSDHLPSWSARSGGMRAITTGYPMLDVLIMTTVVAVFAGKGAMGLRQWFHRRSFLARPSRSSRTP